MVSSSVYCTLVHSVLLISVLVNSADHNAPSARYATVRHLITNKAQPVYSVESRSLNNRQLFDWQPEMSASVPRTTHRPDKQQQKKVKRGNRRRRPASTVDQHTDNNRAHNDNRVKRRDKKREIIRLRKSKENYIPLNYIAQNKLERKIRKKKLARRKGKQLAANALPNGTDTIMNMPARRRAELSLNSVDTRVSTEYNNSIVDCHCSHVCARDGRTCSCFKGFRLRADGRTCKDINECRENQHRCSHECQNLPGSYRCLCPDGYRLDGAVCWDVNECLLNNGHGPCQDTCRNTAGTYMCTCERLPGTQLAGDGRKCVTVNQCQQNQAGCSHECLSARGSAYCLCPSGMQLRYDWKTCEAIPNQ